MVLVTDKQYGMEPRLKEKLDLMIKRMKVGKDNLIIIDGDEGDGKSNLEVALAYYFAYNLKRDFGMENIFFDLTEMTNYALRTKEQIICWDEGALGGMAIEWWKKNQIKFIKMLMVARKRQHIFIICIPKFFKLNEYLIIDRSVALINVYLRGGTQHGRYAYFTKKAKERLWEKWRRTKKRDYNATKSFRGTFGLTIDNNLIINDEEYNAKKDIAIMSIEKEDDTEDARSVRKNLITNAITRTRLLGYKFKIKELADIFGMNESTMKDYSAESSKFLKKNPDSRLSQVQINNNRGVDSQIVVENNE